MNTTHNTRGRLLRRIVRLPLLALLVAAAATTGCVTVASAATGHEQQDSPTFHRVKVRAAALAARPYEQRAPDLPPFLADLNYDQYRDVRFHPQQGLWVKDRLPFQVQFFSRGAIFAERVDVYVVDRGKATRVDFDPALFDFGRLPVPESVPKELGFAGFRLHYPFNRRNVFDEVVAFLGASYFRAVGRREVYGLSARGLALDTGLDRGEEFPVFREFWLEKPPHGAKSMTLYALLDSPSVSGAYRFVVTPGGGTTLDVTAQLFFRDAVDKVGIAPLTSMYWHGENTEYFVDDFRPEVHDSDGLLIAAGNGERLWRPLNNPQRLAISQFRIENPRGFGLLQRDRDYEHYQDLESDYQRRPSAWVEPVGDWGAGTVELVEIPTASEYHDNIVAFWVPPEPVVAGSEHSFQYRVTFVDDPVAGVSDARVTATRIGAGDDSESGARRFVLDFAGPALADRSDAALPAADVWASAGTLSKPVVQRNPTTGGLRVFFQLSPGDAPLVELRCNLRADTKVLSETWTYQWHRERR